MTTIPVWLWFIGSGILGIVLAYGVVRNSQRTSREKAHTEKSTRDLYRGDDGL